MYDALPRLTGLSFLHDYNGQKSFSEFLEVDTHTGPSQSNSKLSRDDTEPVV